MKTSLISTALLVLSSMAHAHPGHSALFSGNLPHPGHEVEFGTLFLAMVLTIALLGGAQWLDARRS